MSKSGHAVHFDRDLGEDMRSTGRPSSYDICY